MLTEQAPTAAGSSTSSSTAWHDDIVEESTTIATSRATTADATQTADLDDFQVLDLALDIWLLAKKHRVYEQRAQLRYRQMKSLLDTGITPMWAIRGDYHTRPPYVMITPELVEITTRHAKEVTMAAYFELVQRAAGDKKQAVRYMSIVKNIYNKEGDGDFEKAENRISQIITRYRAQEFSKLESQRKKDLEAYPRTLGDWKTLLEQTPTPSTRRSCSNSASTERKRARLECTAAEQEPSNNAPAARSSNSNPQPYQGRGRGAQAHRGRGSAATSDSNTSLNNQDYNNGPTRGSSQHPHGQRGGGRGGRGGRGRGRGRGATHQTQERPSTSNNRGEQYSTFLSQLKDLLK